MKTNTRGISMQAHLIKKLSLFSAAVFFSLGLLAQSITYDYVPKEINILLNNQTQCSKNKVKTCTVYQVKDGNSEVKSIYNFNSNGKIAKDQYLGYLKSASYYTYSGDTTIERTLAPDNYSGSAGLATVEKFDAAGNMLIRYYGQFENPEDSMNMPPLSETFIYEAGHLAGVKDYSGELYRKCDAHGNLIEYKGQTGIDKYRYVYQGDKILENYYTNGSNPEVLFEKYYYNADGTIQKYERYEKGIVKNTYSRQYDAAKRVIAITGDGNENYTYDAQGNLVKETLVDYIKTVITTIYTYNAQNLLLSSVKTGTGGFEGESFSYYYSFWQ